jgi:hypothetical protein
MVQHTLRVPVTQAGCVIFARSGMALAVDIRDTQLSGAVRLIDAQSDMCTASEVGTENDATFRYSADRNLGYPQCRLLSRLGGWIDRMFLYKSM